RTVRAVPRRLTKPLSEVTVMADNQSTQTRPEFTWLFLATPDHNLIMRVARKASPAGWAKNLADILAYVTFQSPVYIIILLTVGA
ncbi:L-alanine exporter AlaE, partial [Salmonella enterica subsp. enterica serovar Kentucky]|nr:L-alanine exporter AlaE [Salmonella enterica subsp. enterica serovar Kentucky]